LAKKQILVNSSLSGDFNTLSSIIEEELILISAIISILFPLISLIKKMPNQNSLYETILITINDFFVFKFLENKIDFKKMMKLIKNFSN